MQHFTRNHKGLAVVGVVGVLLSIAIGLVIGITILQNFLTSFAYNTEAGSSALTNSTNATLTSLTTNIWTAFNLASILPLIIIAAVMIGAVRMFGGGEGE
jgi:Sec-independent protein secretion pathway component TatC